MKQQIVYIPIDEIKPYERNPRNNAPAVPACMESIKRFGFRGAIDLDEEKVIIRGHTRMMAIRQLRENGCLPDGLSDGLVPCIIHRDMSPEQVRALRVADNKVSELSTWDEELLRVEISEFADFDFSSLGFDIDTIMGDMGRGLSGTDEDAVPEISENEPVVSKRGEVYVLGRHRLMCGDSTKAEDVTRLMAGEKARMVFTDPPWNVAYGETKKDNPQGYKVRTILNDKMTTDDFHAFMDAVFRCMVGASEKGCPTYVVMSAQEWGNLMLALKEGGYHWSSTVIWAKDRLVLSRKDYHTQYEPIWYGWLDGAPRLQAVEDRKQSDLWEIPRPSRSEEHPTMKPVELVVKAVGNSSRAGDTVLDLFGGSGTTLIACEQTNRRARLMELDPHYCDVIRRRWAEFVHGEGCDWEELTKAEGGGE